MNNRISMSLSSLQRESWENTWQKVREILPGATHLTPGSLLKAAESAGRSIIASEPFESAADQSDWFVIRQILAGAKPDETVIVITDRSFLAGGLPFVFRMSEGEQFAAAYLQATGELVMSGSDVVLICPDSRLLILCDHEGGIEMVR